MCMYRSVMDLQRPQGGVVLVLFLLISTSVRSCPPANIPPFVQTGPRTRLEGPVQAIVPSYNFSCYGTVTMWGACIDPGGMITDELYDIYFQVLRATPQGPEGCYDLVGYNFVDRGMGGVDELQRCIVLEDIPPEDQIRVEPGDVVGFRIEHFRNGDLNEGGPQLVTDRTDVTVWYLMGQDMTTGSQVTTCRFRVGPGPELSRLPSSTNHPPVITAQVLAVTFPPTPTPSPNHSPSPSPSTDSLLTSSQVSPQTTAPQVTTSPSPPPHTPSPPVVVNEADSPGSDSNGPAIIIGVVAALLVLVILILIVAILIVVCVRLRNKTSREAVAGRRSSSRESGRVLLKGPQSVSNPNYEVNSPDDVRTTNFTGNSTPAGQQTGHEYHYISQGDNIHEYSYATVPLPNGGRSEPPSNRNHPYAYVNPGDFAPGDNQGKTHLYHTVERGGGAEVQYADPNALRRTSENGYHTLEPEGGQYEDPDRPLRHNDPSPPVFQNLIYSDEAFECAGNYVPTEEQRIAAGDHYEMLQSDQYNRLNFFVDDNTYWAPATTTRKLYEQLALKKYREIPRNQIRLMDHLGEGQFAEVCKGAWLYSEAEMEVAVKMLKPGASQAEKLKFLQEAAIMGQFSSHPNVVTLYGVVTVGEPAMIALELMANGDLRTYLNGLDLDKHRDQNNLQLTFLRFAREIASGMAYLARKSFVHRDLAARNILLDQQMTCKIGDFGMARDLMDDTYYTSTGGKIPVKWTSPEALLYKKFSSDSDTWSYGMVLFEIWSVGLKPFPTLTNNDVVQLVQTGYCQPPPPGCPRGIYELMVDCWHPDHKQRPSFDRAVTWLKQPEDKLLYWSQEDLADAGRLAKILGSPCTESQRLYMDLQLKYRSAR